MAEDRMSTDSMEGAGESRLQTTSPGTPPARTPPSRTPVRDLGGLAIAVALFAAAFMIASDAAQYPIRRSYAQFGPEIFPYIVAIGIAVIAALTVLMAWRGEFPDREPMNTGPVLWIVGAICAQIAILFAGFGFIPASATLFGGAARGLGKRPLVLTIAVGFVISALLYILFRHGLGLSLPAGPVEQLIDGLLR
jgi:putative tricarboxylic transport membrane protein